MAKMDVAAFDLILKLNQFEPDSITINNLLTSYQISDFGSLSLLEKLKTLRTITLGITALHNTKTFNDEKQILESADFVSKMDMLINGVSVNDKNTSILANAFVAGVEQQTVARFINRICYNKAQMLSLSMKYQSMSAFDINADTARAFTEWQNKFLSNK